MPGLKNHNAIRERSYLSTVIYEEHKARRTSNRFQLHLKVKVLLWTYHEILLIEFLSENGFLLALIVDAVRSLVLRTVGVETEIRCANKGFGVAVNLVLRA